MASKFCIFCGSLPLDKNKEHIIPLWLIEDTGNPNRVVTHLYDKVKKKEFTFAFDAFQFPACESCNSDFSSLEAGVKPIIQHLNEAKSVTGSEIVTLLDWLDKVRIGLWLGRINLEKSFEQINPKFFIKSRIGKKDRAVFIYHFPDHPIGISTIGFETYFFKISPCIFGLRINQTLYLNVSYDSIFSKYLGCYFPVNPRLDLDNGLIKNDGFSLASRKPEKLNPKFKPMIAIFQAILDTGQLHGGPMFLKSGVSHPLLLRNGNLSIIAPEQSVEFETVSGPDVSYLWQIAANIYHRQLSLANGIQVVGTKEAVKNFVRKKKIIKAENTNIIYQYISNYGNSDPRLRYWTDYQISLIRNE